MKTKKLLFFIAAALIFSFVFAALASCGNDTAEQGDVKPPADADGDDQGAADSSGGAAEAEEEEKYQFPDKNYNGYTIKLLGPDHWWAMPDFKAEISEVTGEEEENGDPLNDALYKRNRIVMDGLGVEIAATLVGGPEARAKKSIQAGSDDYDAVFTDSAQAGSLASQGLYYDLHGVPGLELDRWYWNQNAHNSAELLGKLYFTTSDAHVITNDAIWIIYFNKKIHQDLGLENPYNLVREGKWTVDAYYNMARDAVQDIDGDGKWTVADRWGISTHGLAFLAYLICQEQSLVRLNEAGEPYLITPDDKFVNAFTKAFQLMQKENGVFLDSQGSYPGRTADLDHATKTFMADMSLFCAEVLSHARVFREMTADFGILPHPKHDEFQQNYYTFMIDTVPAFGIPITADPERAGVFMDAFTAISGEVLMPAYYKISLEGKFTRDEDSIEMLDIIRDGRVFDRSVLFNWGGFYSAIITYGTGREGTNPASVFEKNAGKVEAAIAKTIDAYNSMD